MAEQGGEYFEGNFLREMSDSAKTIGILSSGRRVRPHRRELWCTDQL